MFLQCNRNKRSLTLGLDHRRGWRDRPPVGRQRRRRRREHAAGGDARQRSRLREPAGGALRHHPRQRNDLRRGWTLQRSHRVRRHRSGPVGRHLPAGSARPAHPRVGALRRLRHGHGPGGRRHDGALSPPADGRGSTRRGRAAPDRAHDVERAAHRARRARRRASPHREPRLRGRAVRPLRGRGRVVPAPGGRASRCSSAGAGWSGGRTCSTTLASPATTCGPSTATS